MQSSTAKELTTVVAKPILKWAGGKTQMLSELLPKVPPSYGRYIEPFFGGGALFFALQPEKAIVADSNPELINMYRQVAEHVDDVISYLKNYENTSEMFYSVRSLDWETLPKAEAAARTIYLNKTCYNGLFRVNSSGQFNAPWGRYKNPNISGADNIRAMSAYLNRARVTIKCGDYREALKGIRKGAFVYFDPPYMPLSSSSSFTGYTASGFGEAEQIELKRQCDLLDKRGIKFLLSNSCCEFIENLYSGYTIERVSAKRAINAKADKRGAIDEVLVRNY